MSAKAALSLGDNGPPHAEFPAPLVNLCVRSPPLRVRGKTNVVRATHCKRCKLSVQRKRSRTTQTPHRRQGQADPMESPRFRGESTPMEHVHPIPCRMTVQKVQQRVRDCSLSRVTTDEEDKASHTQHEGWGPQRASVPFEWCQTYLPLARQVL